MAKKKATKTQDPILLPLSSVKPEAYTIPYATPTQQIIQIPPYEDSGVKFQGYSKRKLGDGSYLLVKQERKIIYSSSNVAATLYTVPAGKIFVCDKIIINPANSNTFYFSESGHTAPGDIKIAVTTGFVDTSGTLTLRIPLQIDFNTPIVFDNDVYMFMSVEPSSYTIMLYGWIEDH